MQLKSLLLAVVLASLAAPAPAQSLSPMQKSGTTPSDTKGFKLTIGNPYPRRMTFMVQVLDPDFARPVADAVAGPAEFRLAPGASRNVTVLFKIDPKIGERTIGVCVLPADLEGTVQPRVCGTYHGTMLGRSRG